LKYFLTLLLLVFLIDKSTTAQALDCRVALAIDGDVSSIEITDLHLISNHESSGLRIDVINLLTKPIIGLLMIVDLQDILGKNMLSVPVYTLDGRTLKPLDTRIQPWLKAHDSLKLTTGILPGSKLTVQSWSPVILTKCPSNAKLHLLGYETADGSVIRSQDSDWSVNPVLAKAQYTAPTFSHSKPVRFSAQVRVDTQGRGTVKWTDATGQIKDWFQTLLTTWEFTPSMREGSPANGEVSILCRVDENARSYQNPFWFQSKKTPNSAIVVRALTTSAPYPQVFQGGRLIDSEKRRIR